MNTARLLVPIFTLQDFLYLLLDFLLAGFRKIHSHRSMAMYLTGSFPNRSGNICSQHPLPSKSSREVTKEQIANLYHRNFTSAGYSASSVEKYHYPSDCHRRNRGNLLLIPGVLAVLQCRSHGVPDKVAKIIRIKVLVNDLFSCQNTSEWADLFVVRN